MSRLILLSATLTLACGTMQSTMAPGVQVLSDGFPSKPHPAQQHPGKDGRRRLPPG